MSDLAPYIKQLDDLYTADLNDVEDQIVEMSRSNLDKWYRVAMSEDAGYDLRGMAARVYTLGWYTKGEAGVESLRALIDRGELLVKLGIFYALDDVDDRGTAKRLFDGDPTMMKRIEKYL